MEFSLDNEDIHMNIETHADRSASATRASACTPARSRNDQVAVDIRLYREGGDPVQIIDKVLDLEQVLVQEGQGATWTPSCPATPTCSGPSPPPSPTT